MCTSPDEIQIPDIKIWDATRATFTAPAYFKPFYSSRSKVSAAKLRNAKSSSTMANFTTTQLGQNTLFFDDF
jgi:patatin-like phospholipase/acyl hydrolase